MDQYHTYDYRVVRDGIYLRITFVLPTPPAGQMDLANPLYFNFNTLTAAMERLNPDLVDFGDRIGIVTVDWNRNLSFVSVSRADFIAQVLAL